MHSSRMHTGHSSSQGASVHAGIHPPRCGPGDPPRCGPGDPPRPVNSTSPLGVGLETPPARPLNFPLGVGLETCKACWDTTYPPGDLLQGMLGYHMQCMLGYRSPPCEQNHRDV